MSKGGTRPDDTLKATGNGKFRVGSWNVGSLTGKGLETAEELGSRGVVVGCLQETRWRGDGKANCRFMGEEGRRYKVYWTGNKQAVGGVGIMVAEKWVDKVVEVVRVYDRLMIGVIMVGKEICKFISA